MSRASIIDALQSILDKSNAKTGASDTTVTAASDRLIRGYEGGASDIIAEIDVQGDGTNTLSFECEEEPDIVVVCINGFDFSAPVATVLNLAAFREKFILTRRHTGTSVSQGSTSNIGQDYPWGEATGNGYASASYTDGVFSIYYRGASNQYKWSASYTFDCIAIKL